MVNASECDCSMGNSSDDDWDPDGNGTGTNGTGTNGNSTNGTGTNGTDLDGNNCTCDEDGNSTSFNLTSIATVVTTCTNITSTTYYGIPSAGANNTRVVNASLVSPRQLDCLAPNPEPQTLNPKPCTLNPTP